MTRLFGTVDVLLGASVIDNRRGSGYLSHIGIALALLLAFACACSKQVQLNVKQIEQPDYPSPARYENIQGTVQVEIGIGADGKVIFAKGSGASRVLQRAAEVNARQWVFGPFPRAAEFPMYHTIDYVYRLEGKPLVVAIQAHVRTYLPDRIEIIAAPLVSDYPPLSYDKNGIPEK